MSSLFPITMNLGTDDPTEANHEIERLLSTHESLCNRARELMRRKNHDYTQGSAKPLANFELAVQLGAVGDVDKSVYIRFLDKVARLATLLNKEPQVKDESFDDTILDIINYSILMMYARQIMKEKYAKDNEMAGVLLPSPTDR